MTLLPIVVRELRVAARRKSTYRVRFWTVFAMIVFGSFLAVLFTRISPSQSGPILFSTLAILCFFSCLSLTQNTLDCVSEEKREGTLGFLFLTDLKGYDVALGKLFSFSLNSFYSILGIFPIVAVTLLMGGVSARAFWQMALALLNVFFFSQTAGLFISSLSRRRNRAGSAAAALLLIYLAGLPLLAFGLRATRYGEWVSLLGWFNPAYCVYCASLLNFSGSFAWNGHYWISLVLVHLNAWLFLTATSWWLPRCWQEKTARRTVPVQTKPLPASTHFGRRRSLLDKNPFYWLAIRKRWGALKCWSVLLSFYGYSVWWLSRQRSFEDVMPLFFSMVVWNQAVLKLFVAHEASNHVEEQRRNGGLELLLSCTPLTVREIIDGQLLALHRQFLSPAIAVLVIDFVLMVVADFGAKPGFELHQKWGFALAVLASMIMLAADSIALAWVGMWNAMCQKKPRQAAGTTVSLVLVLPWVFFGYIIAALGIAEQEWWQSLWFLLPLWFVLGIAVDVPAFFYARYQLLTQFRALAAVPGGEAVGLLGFLGRMFGLMARPKAGA